MSPLPLTEDNKRHLLLGPLRAIEEHHLNTGRPLHCNVKVDRHVTLALPTVIYILTRFMCDVRKCSIGIIIGLFINYFY